MGYEYKKYDTAKIFLNRGWYSKEEIEELLSSLKKQNETLEKAFHDKESDEVN